MANTTKCSPSAPGGGGRTGPGRDKVFHNDASNALPKTPSQGGRPRRSEKELAASWQRKRQRERERQRRLRADPARRDAENAKRRKGKRGTSRNVEREMNRLVWLVAHHPNCSYRAWSRLYAQTFKESISADTIRRRLRAAAQLDLPLVRLRAPKRTEAQVLNEKGHGQAFSRFHVTRAGLESLGDRAPRWWIDLSAAERELHDLQDMAERLSQRMERYEHADRVRALRKYHAERRLRERLAAKVGEAV